MYVSLLHEGSKRGARACSFIVYISCTHRKGLRAVMGARPGTLAVSKYSPYIVSEGGFGEGNIPHEVRLWMTGDKVRRDTNIPNEGG